MDTHTHTSKLFFYLSVTRGKVLSLVINDKIHWEAKFDFDIPYQHETQSTFILGVVSVAMLLSRGSQAVLHENWNHLKEELIH